MSFPTAELAPESSKLGEIVVTTRDWFRTLGLDGTSSAVIVKENLAMVQLSRAGIGVIAYIENMASRTTSGAAEITII